MKRFWTTAEAVPGEAGWSIALDGRPVRTPAKALLIVPSEALAEAIAAEWNACAVEVEPRAMSLTGLANAAIDRAAPDPAAFASSLANYGECDLLCYRAEGPDELVDRQEKSWDPLLAWARRRFDIELRTIGGIVHVAQPQVTTKQLGHAVAVLDPFRLAGLSPLVSIGGSLISGLAVLEGAIGAEQAWSAVTIDERWQLERWGADAEAEAAMENRKRDFFAAARFLELLDPSG